MLKTLLSVFFVIFAVSGVSGSVFHADVTAADQGEEKGTTIKNLAKAIGFDKKAVIILKQSAGTTETLYLVGQDMDLSAYSNITLKFEPGAVLHHGIHKLRLPRVEAGLHRIFSGSGAVTITDVKYPEWFGAKGNNKDDDTAALQAVMNTGGKIKLSDRTYRFSFLTLPAAGTTLEGNGWSSVLTTTAPVTGNTAPAVWIKANDITLKNFKLTWAIRPQALQAFNSINNNSTVSVGWSEIVGRATVIANTVIDHICVAGGKQHGIAVGRSRNVRVVNSTVQFPRATGIWAYYSNSIRIENNRVEETGDDGIYVAANGPDRYGPDAYSINPVISGNTIINAGAKGIGVGGTHGASISNNTIDGTWASAIMAKSDYAGGHIQPVNTRITGNTIRRTFQNYGEGKYRKRHIVSETGGVYAIIECHSGGDSEIRANNIEDRSGLHSHYRALWLSSPRLNISGNDILTDGEVAMVIGSDSPDNTKNVDYVNMTGNKVVISRGKGYQMLSLFGVAGGLIENNHFDCGVQGLSSPRGRFLVTHWATNILFKIY